MVPDSTSAHVNCLPLSSFFFFFLLCSVSGSNALAPHCSIAYCLLCMSVLALLFVVLWVKFVPRHIGLLFVALCFSGLCLGLDWHVSCFWLELLLWQTCLVHALGTFLWRQCFGSYVAQLLPAVYPYCTVAGTMSQLIGGVCGPGLHFVLVFLTYCYPLAISKTLFSVHGFCDLAYVFTWDGRKKIWYVSICFSCVYFSS